MEVIIVFIGIFFGITGAYAIVESLSKLGEHRSDSTIQTGWLKLNAPIGFIYGIFALLIIVGLIKYENYGDQTDEIKKLENIISELENINFAKSQNTNFFKITIDRFEPKSIFNGKVLINYDYHGIQFYGIKGVSLEKSGNFTNSKIKINEGMKIYFITTDSILFGVNIINAGDDAKLEIYKE